MKRAARFHIDGSSSGSFGCIMTEKKYYVDGSHFLLDKEEQSNGITIPQWVEFINKAGFPVLLEEENDAYKVTFNPNDYVNVGHYMAAFTSFRYGIGSYMLSAYGSGYRGGFDKFAATCIELCEKYGVSEFESLQLAHYKLIDSYPDGLHMLLGSPSKLVSLEEFTEKVKRIASCNEAFFKKGCDKSWTDLHKLINENVEECIALLK